VTHDYAEALAEFAVLTDSRTGIIGSVSLIRLSESDPVAFIATTEPCDTTPLVGLPAANQGSACSASAERAVVRACGESVERYCSAFFDTDSLLQASAAELEADGRAYIPTERLYPFAAWQYAQPGFPFEPTTGRTVRWIEGASAISGEPALIPASCVYVPYMFDQAVEPFTHMSISTGLAAGQDVEQCIAKGILEILERDALMIVWHAELAMPRLDPESCLGRSPLIDDLLAVGLRGSSDWFLNVLTLDVDVTIISAALIDPGSPPLTSFGISADPDPERALLLALEEATLTRILVNRLDGAREEREWDPADVQTLEDHLLAHATSSRLRERLGFLTGAPAMDFGELVARAEAGSRRSVEDRVAAAGLEAFWVDVTTEDVAEFGFHVVRTVMPGMQPLDNDHRYPYVGGSRRVTVPRALGLGTPTEATVNPDPHPFP
jgi:ribosomal protein S12 methylthiotransferase accessory factor